LILHRPTAEDVRIAQRRRAHDVVAAGNQVNVGRRAEDE
jgi:hypothetical protein